MRTLVLGALLASVVLPSPAVAGHLLSTTSNANLGGLSFRDGDLNMYDPLSNFGQLHFSESGFTSNEDIDAVSMLSDGSYVLSTSGTARLGGCTFTDGDLVRYDPLSGLAHVIFDENEFRNNENIDAVHVGADGKILLSTSGNARLAGLDFDRCDLVEYDPVTETAVKLFDGSDIFESNSNLDAIHMMGANQFLVSSANSTRILGLDVRDEDLVLVDLVTGSSSLYFDGSTRFSGSADVDAFAMSAVDGVPEPASVLLMGTGLIGLALSTRIRRKSRSQLSQ